METYRVSIIETLEMQVEIEAESLDDAIEKAREAYNDEEYVLSADNANVDVEFVGRESLQGLIS